MKKEEKYNLIYEELKEQLDINNAYNSYTEDLLQDYIKLAKVKDKLNADIDKRGVNVKYNNGGGQTGYKKNDSVVELPKINKQMLMLLKELGLSPSLKIQKQAGDPDGDI